MPHDPDGGADVPVDSPLGRQMTSGLLPHVAVTQFVEARSEHGPWSAPARAALAAELRRAKTLDHAGDQHRLIDGVIAALEDRR